MNETHERTTENKNLNRAEKHGQEKQQELSQHVERIKVQTGELLENTKDKAQDVICQARDYIKANPKKSAGIAVGALVLASALTHRKKVSSGGSKAFMALLASPLIASMLKKHKQH